MSFKLNDFFSLMKKCAVRSDIEIYHIFFGTEVDYGNMSKQLSGQLPIPKKTMRKVILEGKEKIKDRLLKSFPETTSKEFWNNVDTQLDNLKFSSRQDWVKDFIENNNENTPSKLVDLFLGSLVDPITKSNHTSIAPNHIFDFINNEKLDSISEINIMFHSGIGWYSDRDINGRMALISKIMQKGITLKVLINNSESVQKIFDSTYLRSNYGSYDSIYTGTRKWKEQAQKYDFMLRSFEHIFFHSMCIIHYKNSRKRKLYLSHYIYQEGLTPKEHPKEIIDSENIDFNKYYNEYCFIWDHAQRLYPEGQGDGSNNV